MDTVTTPEQAAKEAKDRKIMFGVAALFAIAIFWPHLPAKLLRSLKL